MHDHFSLLLPDLQDIGISTKQKLTDLIHIRTEEHVAKVITTR